MKSMSQRQERVAELIRKELGSYIVRHGFDAPELAANVNVTHVWVSPDLRVARAYFASMIEGSDEKQMSKLLNAERYKVQKFLGSIGTKYTPKITFFTDKDHERVERVEEIFEKVRVREGISS